MKDYNFASLRLRKANRDREVSKELVWRWEQYEPGSILLRSPRPRPSDGLIWLYLAELLENGELTIWSFNHDTFVSPNEPTGEDMPLRARMRYIMNLAKMDLLK
jgi:hypothetical protein